MSIASAVEPANWLEAAVGGLAVRLKPSLRPVSTLGSAFRRESGSPRQAATRVLSGSRWPRRLEWGPPGCAAHHGDRPRARALRSDPGTTAGAACAFRFSL